MISQSIKTCVSMNKNNKSNKPSIKRDIKSEQSCQSRMKKLKQVTSHQRINFNGGERLFSTNHVLIEDTQKSTTVYLPGYLRIKFKNFLQLDLTNLTSLINATIIFNIYYGDLFDYDPNFQQKSENLKTIQEGKSVKYQVQQYKDELIEMFMTEVKLNFSRDSAILLSQKTNDNENLQIDVKHVAKDKQVKFTVRKTFHVHLDGDLRWSPFEVINSILQITVQPIAFKVISKNYTFKVNLMEHSDNQLKLSFGEEKNFGHYGLAVNLARTAYTNVKVEKAQEFEMSLAQRQAFLKQKNPQDYNQIKQNKKIDIKYFQYAYFNIPMYKFPSSSLVTVFIPLWLLGLINLGIYFQDQKLSDRLGSIIALMLAFIAYIPTIAAAIPPSANIVFMQGMVYMQSLASLMTFIHSMRIRNTRGFKLVWYLTPQYWITLIVTAGSFLLVMGLMVMHYCFWVRGKYNEGEDDKLLGKKCFKRLELNHTSIDQVIVDYSFETPNKPIKQKKNKMFDRKTWSNLACDLYFNRYYTFQRRKYVQKLKQQKPFKQLQPQSKPKNQEKKQFQQYFIIKMRQKPLYGLEGLFYSKEEGHLRNIESQVQMNRHQQ